MDLRSDWLAMSVKYSPLHRYEDRELNQALRTLRQHGFQLEVDTAPAGRQQARRWLFQPVTGTWNLVYLSLTPWGFDLAVSEVVPGYDRNPCYRRNGAWADLASPTRTDIAHQVTALARNLAAGQQDAPIGQEPVRHTACPRWTGM